MDIPDSDGYVNVTWPSKSIPHGGIFHPRVVEPNKSQQEFLKVLLQESKLSIAQRQKGGYTLRQQEIKTEKQPRIQEIFVRPRTSRRRSLSAIRESGVLDVDHFRNVKSRTRGTGKDRQVRVFSKCQPYVTVYSFRPLKRGEDREKLKNELADTMAYGDKTQTPTPPPPPTRLVKQQRQLPNKKEQWNDLITQIRERAEWLAEMEDLGQGAQHRELIKDQIAERIRALDSLGIDSQRSSARSSASGFSVVPSVRSGPSTHSANSKTSKQDISARSQQILRKKALRKQEENVATYGKLSPLQYSPRRRV